MSHLFDINGIWNWHRDTEPRAMTIENCNHCPNTYSRNRAKIPHVSFNRRCQQIPISAERKCNKKLVCWKRRKDCGPVFKFKFIVTFCFSHTTRSNLSYNGLRGLSGFLTTVSYESEFSRRTTMTCKLLSIKCSTLRWRRCRERLGKIETGEFGNSMKLQSFYQESKFFLSDCNTRWNWIL